MDQEHQLKKKIPNVRYFSTLKEVVEWMQTPSHTYPSEVVLDNQGYSLHSSTVHLSLSSLENNVEEVEYILLHSFEEFNQEDKNSVALTYFATIVQELVSQPFLHNTKLVYLEGELKKKEVVDTSFKVAIGKLKETDTARCLVLDELTSNFLDYVDIRNGSQDLYNLLMDIEDGLEEEQEQTSSKLELAQSTSLMVIDQSPALQDYNLSLQRLTSIIENVPSVVQDNQMRQAVEKVLTEITTKYSEAQERGVRAEQGFEDYLHSITPLIMELQQGLEQLTNQYHEKEVELQKVKGQYEAVIGQIGFQNQDTGSMKRIAPSYNYKGQKPLIVIKEVDALPYITSYVSVFMSWVRTQFQKAIKVVIIEDNQPQGFARYEKIGLHVQDTAQLKQAILLRDEYEVLYVNEPSQTLLDGIFMECADRVHGYLIIDRTKKSRYQSLIKSSGGGIVRYFYTVNGLNSFIDLESQTPLRYNAKDNSNLEYSAGFASRCIGILKGLNGKHGQVVIPYLDYEQLKIQVDQLATQRMMLYMQAMNGNFKQFYRKIEDLI